MLPPSAHYKVDEAIMSEVVGTLTLRQRVTKQFIGVITVRRLAGDIVRLDAQVGFPEMSIELEPNIALALADLLMDAAAPKIPQ